MTIPFFEVDSPDVLPPRPAVSREVRRRERQAECLAHGLHPLTAAVRFPIGLHPEAAPADDRTATGRRCSTCVYRELLRYHNRTYPKCVADQDAEADGLSRVTHGAGTDVRAWWPACALHVTREEAADA